MNFLRWKQNFIHCFIVDNDEQSDESNALILHYDKNLLKKKTKNLHLNENIYEENLWSLFLLSGSAGPIPYYVSL